MTITSCQHKCANCDYWIGERKLINFGRQVEYDPNAKGSCNKPGSGSRQFSNWVATWTCRFWKLWGAAR